MSEHSSFTMKPSFWRGVAHGEVDRYVVRFLVGLCFSAIFLVAGHFWFFSIVGLKTESQLILYSLVVVFSIPIAIRRVDRYILEPLFILSLSFLFSALLLGRGVTLISNNLLSVLLVAVVFCLSMKYCQTIIKCTIIFLGFFSTLAIIQFVVLWFHPELARHISSFTFEENYLLHRSMDIHPLLLFGFATGEAYEILGHPVTRVSSFLKEPSLIVSYFLIMGALALTYRGVIRLLAVPLIVFSLISMSGAVWVSIVLSLGSLGLFIILRRKPWTKPVMSSFPFVVLSLFVLMITQFKVEDMVGRSMVILAPMVVYASTLDKERSMTARLSELKSGLEDVKGNLLGQSYGVSEIGGTFFYSLFYSGIVGAMMLSLVMYESFKLLALLYFRKGYALSVILMFGSYLQAFLFTSGGFAGPTGFLVMALVLRRLRELKKTNPAFTPERIYLGHPVATP